MRDINQYRTEARNLLIGYLEAQYEATKEEAEEFALIAEMRFDHELIVMVQDVMQLFDIYAKDFDLYAKDIESAPFCYEEYDFS